MEIIPGWSPAWFAAPTVLPIWPDYIPLYTEDAHFYWMRCYPETELCKAVSALWAQPLPCPPIRPAPPSLKYNYRRWINECVFAVFRQVYPCVQPTPVPIATIRQTTRSLEEVFRSCIQPDVLRPYASLPPFSGVSEPVSLQQAVRDCWWALIASTPMAAQKRLSRNRHILHHLLDQVAGIYHAVPGVQSHPLSSRAIDGLINERRQLPTVRTRRGRRPRPLRSYPNI